MVQVNGCSYQRIQRATSMASATKLNSNAPLTNSGKIVDTVTISNEAKQLMDRRGISENENSIFKEILSKATKDKGQDSPKSFLNSLSSSELEVVRKVHGIAAGINVNGLDFEGASNLLRQPGDYQDLDQNGLHTVGLGNSRVFPPQNAPPGVQEAWNKASAGIPGPEGFKAIIMRAPFMAMELSANINYDERGTPVGVYSPHDSGYKDIYSQSGFSYLALTEQGMANLEKQKANIPGEYYSAINNMLAEFKKGLIATENIASVD